MADPQDQLPFLDSTQSEALKKVADIDGRLRSLPYLVEVGHQHGDSPERYRFATGGALRGWIVSGLVSIANDALGVRELSIRPASDSDDAFLSGARLKKLSVETLVEVVRKTVALQAELDALKTIFGAGAFKPHRPLRSAAVKMADVNDTARGRRPLDDAYLRRLAEAYLSVEPRRRGLYKRLASTLGLDPNDPGTMTALRNHLTTARKRGWLAQVAKSGSRSDQPGPQLRKARKEQSHG